MSRPWKPDLYLYHFFITNNILCILMFTFMRCSGSGVWTLPPLKIQIPCPLASQISLRWLDTPPPRRKKILDPRWVLSLSYNYIIIAIYTFDIYLFKRKTRKSSYFVVHVIQISSWNIRMITKWTCTCSMDDVQLLVKQLYSALCTIYVVCYQLLYARRKYM